MGEGQGGYKPDTLVTHLLITSVTGSFAARRCCLAVEGNLYDERATQVGHAV
jgi:hypothetical protein